MKKFTLNGNTYEAKEFSFNMMCDFQEDGIDLTKLKGNALEFLPLLRHYVAYCSGMDKDYAGEEIDRYISNGGDISEIIETMVEAIYDSAFFKAMTGENKKKAPSAKAEGSKNTKA